MNDDAPPDGSDAPLIICLSISTDDAVAITELIGRRAVIVSAPDLRSVRRLLAAPDPAQRLAPDHDVTERGDLRVNRTAREVTWAGAKIDLSAREFDLLAILATDVGRVWTFEDLMARIWKTRYLGDSDTVVSTVKRLRRRLSLVVQDLRVVSVRGIGFRLVLPES